MAQGYVFEQAEEVLLELLGLSLSAKQIQRVSEHYGKGLEEQSAALAGGEEAAPALALKKPGEVVYGMVDGSMVFLRQKGRTEIKVGRLFRAASRVAVQPKRNEVLDSLYVCHVGGHKKFLQKFEAYCEPYASKVFIADGARWIWNWVEDCHPGAVQILDFYHALEKVGVYAGFQYPDETQRRQWLEAQKQALLGGGVAQLIAELKGATPANKQAGKARLDAVRYYQANQSRMHYHRYREQGLLIGSGAIEAAHRDVVQQRLKLSGQRWSKDGAQQIVNLRACKKSKQWNNVIQLIKNAA